MDEPDEDLSMTQWLKQRGFFFRQLPPHIAQYLNVDDSHVAIIYLELVNPEIENSPIRPELVGTMSSLGCAEYDSCIHAHGIKNLSRLDRMSREALREFEVVFQVRLEPRGPFPQLL